MGWTLNTNDPDAETRAPVVAAVGITFTTLALVAVILRLYVRLAMIRRTGLDDWIIVFTWFMSFGFMVVTILQTKYGLGLTNLADMPDANIYTFGVLQYAGAPFYILSILGFKLSLLASFYRITVQKAHRIAVIAMAVAVSAFHISFLMGQLLLCSPVNKQWDPSVTVGKCLPAVPFYTSMASITIVFDVAIMLLPFPVLSKLQLPLKKKLVLTLLFSLGTFVTIIQIIRIQTIKSLQNYIDSSSLIMWSMVENNLGIIIASVPPLSPLIKSWREKVSSGRATSYAHNSAFGQGNSRRHNQHVNLKSLDPETGRTFDGHQGQNTVVVGQNGAESEFRGDASSEDLINPNPKQTYTIRATTQVTVTNHANEK